MLKVFRDNLKKLAWVLWIVIAVFVLLVFTDFQGAQSGAIGPTATAATVAGETITFADFQRRYETVEDRWRELYGEAYTPEVAQPGVLRLGSKIRYRTLPSISDRLSLDKPPNFVPQPSNCPAAIGSDL